MIMCYHWNFIVVFSDFFVAKILRKSFNLPGNVRLMDAIFTASNGYYIRYKLARYRHAFYFVCRFKINKLQIQVGG